MAGIGKRTDGGNLAENSHDVARASQIQRTADGGPALVRRSCRRTAAVAYWRFVWGLAGAEDVALCFGVSAGRISRGATS